MKKSLFAALAACFVSVSGFASTPQLDIVDTAVSAGQFKTLVAAVQAAGLVATLKSPGPLTVFAPTDAAFAKLPAGTVEALLKDIPTLTKILTYHVVPGMLSAKELVTIGTVRTVEGQDVVVKACGKRLFINESEIIMKNVKASNGVIQIIDAVLLPN